MRNTTKVLLFLLIALLAAPLAAQTQRSAELYQQALRKDRTDGDLEAAIRLYRQVADGTDRALAARALVKIGEAYERLGKEGAESAYRRVVTGFADQRESVQAARVRLTALGSAPDASRRAARQALVLDELPPLRLHDSPQFDYSPAGDRVVLRHEPAGADAMRGVSLLIASSGGAVIDTLLGPEPRVGRISPRWSPDGRFVAFLARTFVEVDPVRVALMIVPADGGAPRVVTTDLNTQNHPATGGLFWTPDSRAITIATRQRLVTFDLAGREVRSVPMPLTHQAQVTGYSADGRWLALHQRGPDTEQQNEKDVWIMPAGGGRAIQITHSPGFDGWPAWTPDGRGLYFVSARSGSTNIWRVSIDPATGLPRGDAEQVTRYADASVLYPRPIAGGSKLAFALVRETSVIHVGSDDNADRRAVARGQKPIVSPDGRTLYFLGQGGEQPGLFAMPTNGGSTRRVTSTVPIGPTPFPSYTLSPDGRALAYFSVLGTGLALNAVPTSGGALRTLARLDSREELVPAWSPAGDRLAYAHGNGLFVVGADGGAPTKIAHLYRWDGWSVRWSPDGEHVAALAWTSPAEPNAVVAVPATGGELRRLTTVEERGYKEGLDWHPDGRRLTYMYYGHDDRRDGSWTAYLDGRPSEPFVDQPTPLWDYVGVWDPHGSRYFFVASGGDRSWDLYVHDTRDRATRLFASRGGESPGAGLPSFSRDGRVIAWPVSRTTRQLWTIDGSR